MNKNNLDITNTTVRETDTRIQCNTTQQYKYLEEYRLSFATVFTNHVVRGINEVFSRKLAEGDTVLFTDHPYNDIGQRMLRLQNTSAHVTV